MALHYDISKAAQAAKVSRHTIMKQMNSGKLSFTVDESGKKVIPVADLEKIYNLAEIEKKAAQKSTRPATVAEEGTIADLRNEIALLKQTISSQKDMIDELKNSKKILENHLNRVDFKEVLKLLEKKP
jgi:predicted site-specific integrase-resolvase